jgi:HD-GYP domain-containing protein (c-di-GMP phosphodiesterase class II)
MAGEVLAALSHALDLVEGQVAGHSERTWLIARRIGQELRLTEPEMESLFFACILKDSGCSTNSARLQRVFGGDEAIAKSRFKFVDWSRQGPLALYAIGSVAPGGTFGEKIRRLTAMVKAPNGLTDEVTADRCTRGAEIALELGFGEDCAEAIRALDEHWDGDGSPKHLVREQIPRLARILCLAQTLEVFATAHGRDAAYRIVRRRRGRWFDPEVVRASLSFRSDQAFWTEHGCARDGQRVALHAPEAAYRREASDTDRICRAFATVVDAKSTFTATHSERVASYAVGIGALVGLNAPELVLLNRAGMLHDIGKLAVPNSILDKPGRLDDDEYLRVKAHPRHSYDILRRIPTFGRVAELASSHHERLDGKGYWRGLGDRELDLATRCLTAADVYDALTADRPYRSAMSHEDALAVMDRDSRSAFDPRCLEALRELHLKPERVQAA